MAGNHVHEYVEFCKDLKMYANLIPKSSQQVHFFTNSLQIMLEISPITRAQPGGGEIQPNFGREQ